MLSESHTMSYCRAVETGPVCPAMAAGRAHVDTPVTIKDLVQRLASWQNQRRWMSMALTSLVPRP